MLRILLAIALTAFASNAFAQNKTKPIFLYGHDMKVRIVGEQNFGPMTPKVGVEFFKDPVTNALVAITESGHLAVVPFTSVSDQKKADWIVGFDLRVRDSNAKGWEDSKKVAGETFKDLGSGKLFFVTVQRAITFADAPSTPPADKDPYFNTA